MQLSLFCPLARRAQIFRSCDRFLAKHQRLRSLKIKENLQYRFLISTDLQRQHPLLLEFHACAVKFQIVLQSSDIVQDDFIYAFIAEDQCKYFPGYLNQHRSASSSLSALMANKKICKYPNMRSQHCQPRKKIGKYPKKVGLQFSPKLVCIHKCGQNQNTTL